MSMINQDQAGEYFNRMAELQELNQQVQVKTAEIAEVTERIGTIQAAANALQNQLNTANRDMQLKRLTHEGFLQLKRDMTEKTEELDGLSNSLAEKKEAVAILRNHLTQARRATGTLRQQMSGDIAQHFADEVVELAGEPLRNLISALVVSRGLNAGYSMAEKKSYHQSLCVAVGEAICKPVAEHHDNAVIEIPDLIQAKDRVEVFINQSAIVPA